MFDVRIDEKYIVYQQGTSEGTQVKYKKGDFWYKKDNQGNEGLCEYLTSHLLRYSSLSESEYTMYEHGLINGSTGCRSRDFLKNPEEELISIYRLYYNETGTDIAKVIAGMNEVEERIRYVVDFVLQSTGLDISDYLSKIITLDRLVLNEDRHLNNIAIIGAMDSFRPAPIFDNGRSLLTANYSINRNLSMEENVKRVVARPFSGSFDVMYDYFGKGFDVDKEAALKWLREEPQSMERDVLIYQIEKLIK
jgi:hypothetical protein